MRLVGILLILLTLLCGCVGTEVGNPEDTKTSNVSVEFSGYDSQQRGALTLASGVEIDEAWLVFDELRLREAANCDGGQEVDVDRAFAVELISGRELPALDGFARPATRYCRLELRFAESDIDALPSEAPAELDGLSILVRGSYDGTPFVVRDDFSDRFRLDGSFTLSEEREPLLVAFALDRWLNASDFEAAAGDSEIVIDDSNNSDLLDLFRDRVRQSAGLFRDSNEDGELQDDEFEELADGDSDDDSSVEETDAGLEADEGDADSDESDASDEEGDAGL